jgi:hypothetical protein
MQQFFSFALSYGSFFQLDCNAAASHNFMVVKQLLKMPEEFQRWRIIFLSAKYPSKEGVLANLFGGVAFS